MEIYNKKIVQEILTSLPEWFGIPSATQEYAERPMQFPILLAEENDEIVGFLTINNTLSQALEIDCMAVKKEFQGKGIGSDLLARLDQFAMDKGIFTIYVKTLDESHPDKYYAQTRNFYQKHGFKKVEVSMIWGEENPCLEMKKMINTI